LPASVKLNLLKIAFLNWTLCKDMNIFLLASLILTGAALITPASVHAENFSIVVSRKANNLFKIDGRDMMIHTRACEAEGYDAKAILKTSASGSTELEFTDLKERCEVEAVYDAVKPTKKKYGVTINRVESDWFEVSGSHLFLRSEARCLLVAVNEAVTLEVSGDIGGYLIFPSGKKCKVNGIYSRVKK
jgi:hypothetical protein